LRAVGSRHLAGVHGITLTPTDYRKIIEREHAGRADGALPDGTPYFGKLGEMAYDPDTKRCSVIHLSVAEVGRRNALSHRLARVFTA